MAQAGRTDGRRPPKEPTPRDPGRNYWSPNARVTHVEGTKNDPCRPGRPESIKSK
jgi:hypothetical protein